MIKRNWLSLSRLLVSRIDLDFTMAGIQETLGEYALAMFGEGVVPSYVYPNPFPITMSGSVLGGTVGTGIGFDVNGQITNITASTTGNPVFTLTAADPTNPRWDLLCIEYIAKGDTLVPSPSNPATNIFLNLHDDFQLVVVPGTPAASPAYPAKGNPLYIVLAGIRVPAAATLGTSCTVDLNVRELASRNNSSQLPIDQLNANSTQNLGLSADAVGGLLEIALLQNDGNPGTSLSPVVIDFRSPTSTTGLYTKQTVTSFLNFNLAAATATPLPKVPVYIWVYALNNSGTIELACSYSKVYDDYSIQNSVVGVTNELLNGLLISAVARTNVPIRLIGRVLVTPGATSWSHPTTEVSVVSGKQAVTTTDWVSFTPVIEGSSTNPTVPGGAIANVGFWRRTGDSIEMRIELAWTTAGTAGTGGSYTWRLPNSLTFDVSKLAPSGGSINLMGTAVISAAASGYIGFCVANGPSPSVANGVELLMDTAAATVQAVGSAFLPFSTANAAYALTVKGPITGWSTYGP